MPRLAYLSAAFLLVLATGTTPAQPHPNTRPIVGILTNPNDEPVPRFASVPGYFPASYVKWLEMAGARVVPLPFDRPDAVRALLPLINGALFTGGDANFTFSNGTLTPLAQTGALIFEEVVAAAARGETWPLWGTCQGFHLIAFLASGLNASTAEYGFDSENASWPLDFTPAADKSVLFGRMPAPVRQVLATQPVTMNAHHYGVPPANFNAAPGLASRFTVLSTNVDRRGREFVSAMEGFRGPARLPVLATQYHPEKPQFEWWSAEAMNHSPESVLANLWPALVFVNLTRSNHRAFPNSSAEAAALIYNYVPFYTGLQDDPEFEQVYFV